MSQRQDRSSTDPTPLLLTVDEAARLLAVGRTSVYQLIWDGELTPVRIGRCVRLAVAELERFVNERTATCPTTG
jgi:excisionase family DNA binding protein